MYVCYGYNLFRRSFPDLISSTNQFGVCKYYSLISIEHKFLWIQYMIFPQYFSYKAKISQYNLYCDMYM